MLTCVLSGACWQLALGVAIRLGISLVLDRWSGAEMMGGSGAARAGDRLLYGRGRLLAAAGRRRGPRVKPTEALRADRFVQQNT
jgi:hypothetical protein